eukprot:g3354.t1
MGGGSTITTKTGGSKPRGAARSRAGAKHARAVIATEQTKRASAYQAGFERLHRSYGGFLIQNLCLYTREEAFAHQPEKQLPARVMITACHILQSFYCFASFLSEDVRLAALASLSLACKVEEVRTPMKVLVNHFMAMNANPATASRALVTTGAGGAAAATGAGGSSTAATSSSLLSPAGGSSCAGSLAIIHVPQVADMERRILRLLGFELYEYCSFCPGAHVHNLLMEAFDFDVEDPGVDDDHDRRREVLQQAVAFANDSLRTSVCCRYGASVILRACVELAGRKCRVPVGMLVGNLVEKQEKAVDGDLVEKVMRELLAVYRGGEYFNLLQEVEGVDANQGGDERPEKKSSDDDTSEHRRVDLVFPARADSPSSDGEDSL